MGVLTRESARVAAKWWADKVSSLPHHDNGAGDAGSLLAGILADTMNEEVMLNQRNHFIDILTEKLLEENDSPYGTIHFNSILSCDYSPSRFLSDIAKEAGISRHNFPWKTFMYVHDDGHITVSDGYRSPHVQIWPITEGG